MFDTRQLNEDFADPLKRRDMLDEAKLTIESFAPKPGYKLVRQDRGGGKWADIEVPLQTAPWFTDPDQEHDYNQDIQMRRQGDL